MKLIQLTTRTVLLIVFFSCQSPVQRKLYKTTGSIERIDKRIDEIIPADAVIEIIACGFSWSEGPLWIEEGQFLLFSDVPENKIYKWTEADSISVYLEPSGSTEKNPILNGEGSNGLLLDSNGKLVLCQHGDRRIAKMKASVLQPSAVFETIADNYQGSRFNSPNDATYNSKGQLFFTDPPYGLPGDTNIAELNYCGVFRIDTDGTVTLLDSTLTRPNGIALSPDESKLYVANSDKKRPIWKVYKLDNEGNVVNDSVFFDATDLVPGNIGSQDGMKVGKNGIIYATGPGGLLIISPEGDHLGTVRTETRTSNITFSKDESVIYLTADDCVMRIVR